MRFLKISANPKGRDFVIGDIHGCYNALMTLLDIVKFNPSCDRLFSVGDIIDRGPDSEKCLQLLFEPWFFVVKGNHETMFCDAVVNKTTFMRRTDYFNDSNGGAWTKPWFARNASELNFWSKQLGDIPYVIAVERGADTLPFWVVHAELRSADETLREEFLGVYLEKAQEDDLAILQWSRKIAKKSLVNYVPTFSGPVYCGHTPTANPPEILLGHWNLDGGAGKWGGLSADFKANLVMLCHNTGETHSVDVSGEVYIPDFNY